VSAQSLGPPWWAALPPAEARIRCGTGEHVLRWAEGRLTAADHADAQGELVLAALGGGKAGCVALLEAWGTHAADLDVLALGPRSPADELAVTPELVDELRMAFGPAARSVPMRPGPAAPGPGPLRGGARPGARALRGMPMRRLSPEQERARAQRVELLSLFALGRDFQLRLSAQVAAAWSGGSPDGPARDRRDAQPALAAALAGRLAPAAGPWLGIDPDEIRASLHDGPGWGSTERDGPGLRAALPLSWLARIWAPGFPVADGHLIVDVLEVSWPRVRVLGLPAPGAEPAVLSIRPDGEHWSRARER
jgi:hypothetical protein